jgi:hypothetical protein
LLYERLGHPPAWKYRFLPDSPELPAHPLAPRHETSAGEVQPWTPPAGGAGDSWRFEAENEWPPLAQTGSAWAEPIWVTDTCASPAGSGRALAIHADSAGGTVVLALPIPRAGAWRLTPRFLVDGETKGVRLEVLGDDDAVLTAWTPNETGGPGVGGERKTCIDAPARVITVTDDRSLRLAVVVPAGAQSGPSVAPSLDRILLSPSPR